MVVSGVEKQYKKYLNQKNSRWEFGNSILYQICKDNPLHNDAEYGDFVCRMLELQGYLDEKLKRYEKPRTIDSFLLSK